MKKLLGRLAQLLLLLLLLAVATSIRAVGNWKSLHFLPWGVAKLRFQDPNTGAPLWSTCFREILFSWRRGGGDDKFSTPNSTKTAICPGLGPKRLVNFQTTLLDGTSVEVSTTPSRP